MELWVPSSSPMFALSPCKGCATGWAYEPPPIANATGLGNPVGYGWTTGSPGTVSLNFTGTGISFQLHGTLTPESTVLSINGTEYAGLEAQDIPWGLHSVHLIVDPGPNVMNTTQTARRVTVAGATIALGTMSSATTRNVTVDDTDWRSGKVVLSSGWNMLEKDQSNWINSTQMEMEQPNAGKYWNQSVSWTEQQGANTTVLFSGSAVRAYGISGAGAGSYAVWLDNALVGSYNASAGPRAYGSILYTTTGLAETNHTLTLVNLEQGKRLSFDRIESWTGLMQADDSGPSPLGVPSGPIPSSSLPASQPHSGLSRGTIAGISIGAVAGLTGLLLGAWTVYLLWSKRKKHVDKTESEDTPTLRNHHNSFWRWSSTTGTTGQSGPSRPSKPPEVNEPFRPFVPLREKLSAPNLGTAIHRLGTPSPPPSSFLNSTAVSSSNPVNLPGRSFLKLSKSPRAGASPLSDTYAISPPIPALPAFDADLDPTHRSYRNTALYAALSDTVSPLSTLKESYLPRLGAAKLGRLRGLNRSISIKTALDNEDAAPDTPRGILDAGSASGSGGPRGGEMDEPQRDVSEWDKEESTWPSMGERHPKRFFGKMLGEREWTG